MQPFAQGNEWLLWADFDEKGFFYFGCGMETICLFAGSQAG
jgi:hypothetical protein